MDSLCHLGDVDQESLATSSNYPQSWSSHSLPAEGSPCMLPPSDNSIQLNDMYLECKTDMLEIIEEGLQLKLEIQGIKDQFLNLIKDFDDFEQNDKHCAVKPQVNMPHHRAAASDTVGGVKVSAARMRVRALYEARKARIRARRSASIDSPKDFDTMAPPSKMAKVHLEDEEDKENMYKPPMACHRVAESNLINSSHKLSSMPMAKSLQEPMQTMTWSIRRFLTPIKEDLMDQSSSNVNCLPKNLLTSKGNTLSRRSSTKSKDRSNRENLRDLSDGFKSNYSKSSAGSFNSIGSAQNLKHSSRSSIQWHKPEDGIVHAKPKRTTTRHSSQRTPKSKPQSTDADNQLSPFNCRLTNQLRQHDQRPYRQTVPIQLNPDQDGPSDTVKELKDISQISDISRCDNHEQVSSANLSGAFHSTFNYPLHSTLNYPLHSTFSMSDDTVLKCMEDESSKDNSDSRTTLSEPITTCHQHQTPVFSRPGQTLDESCLDYHTFASKMTSSSGKHQQSFSPSSYNTPSKKPQAQLCKEHGIHPTFGGLCLFQTPESATFNSSDDEVGPDENGNRPKVVMNVTDTDCDSSYLSEYIDDQQTSIDVDEYAALFNMRSPHVRMLRRQTGQAELFEIKDPIGLSESDLNFDMTKNNFSIDASRASIPNFQGLTSVMLPETEEDESESTLHASSPRKVPGLVSPNDTLVNVDQRPLSESNTEESPESNTGISVPVNSPNITDSGGSSSRPNTDNYDCMEMLPEETPAIPSDHASLHGSHSSRSHHSHKALSTHSHHSSKSRQHQRQYSHINHRSRRRYSSTPDTRSTRAGKSKSSCDSQISRRSKVVMMPVECRNNRSRSRAQNHDWDSGCSSHSSQPCSKEFTISDNTGRQRTIVHNSSTSQKLPHDRRKVLAKKLKHFSNSFYKATSTGNLQIQTLGHF